MLLPELTVAGPVLVIARSAEAATVVLAEPVLLPELESGVVLVAVAELLMAVPAATLAPTWTTIVKLGVAPAATVGLVKVTVPVPPTAGALVAQPAGAEAETKVVPAGTTSERTTPWASLGPLLVRVTVYVRLVP